MSDVLSQNEIDDLLAALSTGEVDVTEIEEDKREKRARKYDFSPPDKFAKDQLRTLEIIHENFSRLLNNFLSGYLRIATEVNVISTQSLIYSEFNNSISNPAKSSTCAFCIRASSSDSGIPSLWARIMIAVPWVSSAQI